MSQEIRNILNSLVDKHKNLFIQMTDTGRQNYQDMTEDEKKECFALPEICWKTYIELPQEERPNYLDSPNQFS